MNPITKERTLGDGMDNILIALTESKTRKFAKTRDSSSFTGDIIPIVPKYVPSITKPKYLLHKPREPKFVPYEPYKCAVEPILPKKFKVKALVKRDRNNVDIQDLVEQMSQIRIEVLNKGNKSSEANEPLITMQQWTEEKQAYETDIKNLRETNAHLENQLKFQAQVNSELKTLLVAAVGEDLETRVQHLTEDKLQLARALLNSANHLTSHQEQTEWLSGQCEVWRSKFLASSLMVEELARWKSALTKRLNDLQENIKQLLEERSKLRQHSLKTYRNLKRINQKITEKKCVGLKYTNNLEVALANCKLTEGIVELLFSEATVDDEVENFADLPFLTLGESRCAQLLKEYLVLSNKPDSICNSGMEAAIYSSGQRFLHNPITPASCCAHCKGEMEEV